jgi:protein-tyrosine phosphatase
MTSILMVCLGNICRSPLAEGILKSKVNSNTIFVDSAGTGNWHVNQLPDKRSIAVAKKNGIDLTNQRCRQFIITDFDKFDYIYVMDTSNYSDIINLARNESDKQKVHLILDENFPQKNKNVPDPYYDGENGFNIVFEMLDKACKNIALKLNNK